jgi:hypothetical protein
VAVLVAEPIAALVDERPGKGGVRVDWAKGVFDERKLCAAD